MPQMADIVVKKHDGTTDVTYSKLVPSAGDKSPALWRQTSASGIPSAGPTLSISSKSSVNRKVRIVEGEVLFPITVTDSGNGVTTVVDRDKFTFSLQLKSDYAQTLHDEAVAQSVNLIASTLVREILASGYAAS